MGARLPPGPEGVFGRRGKLTVRSGESLVDEGKIIKGRVAESVGRRLRVLMLCAHEPTVDPRIRWEAEGAATQFDVTVMGFNRAQDPLPAIEPCRGYAIHRIPHVEVSALHYFRRLAESLDRT